MFNGHPRGLYVAFFANMGERFGYYTMIAIFVLFLQAKYGFGTGITGQVYSIFIALVYFLPLFGGLLADKILGYGKTISLGLITMFLGYLLLVIPTDMGTGFGLIIAALTVIAVGTGLFKGNVQALVGNLYDDPRYSAKRDNAFSLFYMGINIGAMFAPTAAEAVSNWVLRQSGYTYDSKIPALAHSFLHGNFNAKDYLAVAKLQDPAVTLQTLGEFSRHYINVLSRSYHFAFGVACLSLVVSMIIFWSFRKYYKHADITEKEKSRFPMYQQNEVSLTPQQTKQRLIALGLVFSVIIFFWMAFFQNGACMTYFARDYTRPVVDRATNLWFDLFGLIPIAISITGFYFGIRRHGSLRVKTGGYAVGIIFALLAYLRFRTYGALNPFTPQKFQHFNPFFIVALTPLIIAFNSYLASRGKEPSSPKKIAIGMLIAALGFGILVVGSLGLPDPKSLGGQVAPASELVTPYWLIGSYFTLTIAELFLSPIGISFVSRIAPPKYKGLMQGGWFAGLACGSYLVGIICIFWDKISLSSLWSILVICCIISALIMFSLLKLLDKVR